MTNTARFRDCWSGILSSFNAEELEEVDWLVSCLVSDWWWKFRLRLGLKVPSSVLLWVIAGPGLWGHSCQFVSTTTSPGSSPLCLGWSVSGVGCTESVFITAWDKRLVGNPNSPWSSVMNALVSSGPVWLFLENNSIYSRLKSLNYIPQACSYILRDPGLLNLPTFFLTFLDNYVQFKDSLKLRPCLSYIFRLHDPLIQY